MPMRFGKVTTEGRPCPKYSIGQELIFDYQHRVRVTAVTWVKGRGYVYDIVWVKARRECYNVPEADLDCAPTPVKVDEGYYYAETDGKVVWVDSTRLFLAGSAVCHRNKADAEHDALKTIDIRMKELSERRDAIALSLQQRQPKFREGQIVCTNGGRGRVRAVLTGVTTMYVVDHLRSTEMCFERELHEAD